MKRLGQWLRWRGILIVASLTPACRQIVQCISRDRDNPVSWWARMRIRVHLKICDGCQRYLRQMEFLREAARRSETNPLVGRVLPAAGRERIRRRLEAESRW